PMAEAIHADLAYALIGKAACVLVSAIAPCFVAHRVASIWVRIWIAADRCVSGHLSEPCVRRSDGRGFGSGPHTTGYAIGRPLNATARRHVAGHGLHRPANIAAAFHITRHCFHIAGNRTALHIAGLSAYGADGSDHTDALARI